MSNFSKLPEKWKIVFLIIVFVLILASVFSFGYLLGRRENPAPIIIEKIERNKME